MGRGRGGQGRERGGAGRGGATSLWRAVGKGVRLPRGRCSRALNRRLGHCPRLRFRAGPARPSGQRERGPGAAGAGDRGPGPQPPPGQRPRRPRVGVAPRTPRPPVLQGRQAAARGPRGAAAPPAQPHRGQPGDDLQQELLSPQHAGRRRPIRPAGRGAPRETARAPSRLGVCVPRSSRCLGKAGRRRRRVGRPWGSFGGRALRACARPQGPPPRRKSKTQKSTFGS